MGQQVTKGSRRLLGRGREAVLVHGEEESGGELHESNQQLYISREVLASESSYVSSLNVCISKYLEPLRALSQSNGRVISGHEVRTIFVNFEEIAAIHRRFLSDLESATEELERSDASRPRPRFGPLFLSYAESFRPYTNYVNNYNDAASMLLSCQAKSPELSNLLFEIKGDPDVKGLDLGAYLIMPVQRIPRYIMLLSELLKSMDKRHPDYEPSTKALSIIKEIADFINEEKRIAEQMNKLLEIDHRLSAGARSHSQPFATLLRRDRQVLSECEFECALTEEAHGGGEKKKKKKKTSKRIDCHVVLLSDLVLIAADLSSRVQALFSSYFTFSPFCVPPFPSKCPPPPFFFLVCVCVLSVCDLCVCVCLVCVICVCVCA
eukprot:TRINITY_DN6404_c0_g1_i1.p1 TRINITY_DN6404_c0_g1~~TRINITY_DN6404_c0_g1_i1.p1  ORF type:complete len:379 (+),score=115.60 TRINITY_DN6404_c0_g1_i1:181-1317(+)